MADLFSHHTGRKKKKKSPAYNRIEFWELSKRNFQLLNLAIERGESLELVQAWMFSKGLKNILFFGKEGPSSKGLYPTI